MSANVRLNNPATALHRRIEKGMLLLRRHMKTKPQRVLWLFVGVAILCLLPATAQGSVQAMDGRTLAQRVSDRDDGKDSYAKTEMILVDKAGSERSRVMLLARKKYGDLAKVYIRFNAPPDIEGTAFLAWENREGPDDQYLYLPSLRRVRRIVSSQKDRSFVNSDYTYEDLEKRKVEKDNHRILRSESLGKYDCWILESVPKAASESQYGKLVSWIAKDNYVPVKTEFYDSRNTLSKTYLARDIKKIDGIWTVTESEMHNVKDGTRTILRIRSIRYNTGIPDRVFTTAYLEHGN
jgi:outer membrane lipoprotein-sorting protein